MDNKKQAEEMSNIAPQKRVAAFLLQLKEEGGLKDWDALCEDLYKILVPTDRIHRFAQHLDLWPMPLNVNFTTLSVMLWLATELHSSKRTDEFLAAVDEAEARASENLSPSERDELERCRRIAGFARRAFSGFPAMVLGVMAERGPLNWRQVADETGFARVYVRDHGPGLVDAGYLEKCPSTPHAKRITEKGRQHLKTLTKL